jgi:LPXTG-site transpeptidase (sortase) family protein
VTTSDRRWAPVPGQVRRRIRRGVLAAAALLSGAVLTGGVESVDPGWSETPPTPAGIVDGTGGAGGGAGGVTPGIDDGTTGSVVDPPTRVRIPSIGVDSPLEALGLDSAGALQPPVDFNRAGWYADGTVPGDVGPAVIAGHVDSRKGPAVFFRLYRLRPGDLVQVRRGDRWLGFRVVSTARYAKDRFPTSDVYGPTPDPQLRLITCGGVFNASRRSYVDNVVISAVASD